MGIIALILLIFLAIDLKRLGDVRQCHAHDHPHVAPDAFERWKRLEYVSICLLALALLLPQGVLPLLSDLMPPPGTRLSDSRANLVLIDLLFVGGLAGFLFALIGAAIAGSMAARQRKTLGIVLSPASPASAAVPGRAPDEGGAMRPGSSGQGAGRGTGASRSAAPAPGPAVYVAGTHPTARRAAGGLSPHAIVGACALAVAIFAAGGLTLAFLRARSQATADGTATAGSVSDAVAVTTRRAAAPVSHGARAPHAKRVIALYYPWYQTPGVSGHWAHQSGVSTTAGRMTSHTHYPASGPYDSADAAVIDRHLKQCEQAGIDALACSWWGRGDATDRALRLLCARAARTRVKVCVLWEKTATPGDWRAAQGELNYLLQTFGAQPAYLHEGGKAVVFVFDGAYRAVRRDQWARISADTDPRFAPGAMLLGPGLDSADASLWDGQFTLEATFATRGDNSPQASARAQHAAYAPPTEMSRLLGQPLVVTVMPGYDDRKPNQAAGVAPTTVESPLA